MRTWKRNDFWAESFDLGLGGMGFVLSGVAIQAFYGRGVFLGGAFLWAAVLFGFAVLSFWFVMRAIRRLYTRVSWDQNALYLKAWGREKRYLWAELQNFRLRSYATKRQEDQKAGVKQLSLYFESGTIKLDTHLDDFYGLLPHVNASRARGDDASQHLLELWTEREK